MLKEGVEQTGICKTISLSMKIPREMTAGNLPLDIQLPQFTFTRIRFYFGSLQSDRRMVSVLLKRSDGSRPILGGAGKQ
jgi:hypothetical protein